MFELRPWVKGFIDGQPLARLLRVLDQLRLASEQRPQAIADLLGDDVTYVRRIAAAAAASVSARAHDPPAGDEGLDGDDESEPASMPGAADGLESVDARETRLLAAALLVREADAVDRRRAPNRTPPPRTQLGQMLRYRAFLLSATDFDEARDADAVEPRTPSASGRPRHYAVPADYALMKTWLRRDKERRPDAWHSENDNTLQQAFRRYRQYVLARFGSDIAFLLNDAPAPRSSAGARKRMAGRSCDAFEAGEERQSRRMGG